MGKERIREAAIRALYSENEMLALKKSKCNRNARSGLFFRASPVQFSSDDIEACAAYQSSKENKQNKQAQSPRNFTKSFSPTFQSYAPPVQTPPDRLH
jgi:hypothetical protein